MLNCRQMIFLQPPSIVTNHRRQLPLLWGKISCCCICCGFFQYCTQEQRSPFAMQMPVFFHITFAWICPISSSWSDNFDNCFHLCFPVTKITTYKNLPLIEIWLKTIFLFAFTETLSPQLLEYLMKLNMVVDLWWETKAEQVVIILSSHPWAPFSMVSSAGYM